MRRGAAAAFALALAVAMPAYAEEPSAKALLATLHRAQDELALAGDDARPVHDRLLKLLDAHIEAGAADVPPGDVVRYALSGGDPRIAHAALASMRRTARDAILVRGALAYVSGDDKSARRLLDLIEPKRLRGRLGGLVTMAKAGLAMRAGDETVAERWLMRVRLEAPGTLMEEAALRRLAAIALQRGDAGRTFRIVRHYWVRFPRSAFREQMRRLTYRAVARFDQATMLGHLPSLALALPARLRSDLYAHVARSALIDGRTRLATVAARRHDARLSPARARLLKDLTRLTGRNVERVKARLDAFSPRALETEDRTLLLAARAVAGAVTAPIARLGDADRGKVSEGALALKHRDALRTVDALLVSP